MCIDASGVGTIFGQGEQDRERQNREREIKVFAGIGAFFCRENNRSPKKEKRSLPDMERFLVPKMAQDTGLKGGDQLPPLPLTSRAYEMLACRVM